MDLPALILASSSPYRRELLTRLQLPFQAFSPDLDERPLAGESASALVQRLSYEKAKAIAQDHPDAVIIGSDQVLLWQDQLIGKPSTHAKAHQQLSLLSGQRVNFLTGLCVLQRSSARMRVDVVATEVQYRDLNAAQIERYLQLDQPYDCAGSFKSEAAGIMLCQMIRSKDPTALIGLPLIRLVEWLIEYGYPLP
jgi:MAF protein